MSNYKLILFAYVIFISLINALVSALKVEGIRNGKLANQTEHTYQAGIMASDLDDREQSYICSAVIIDNFFLLAAAHCLFEKDGSLKLRIFYVIVGTDYILDRKASKIDILKIYTYLFNPETLDNDLAILQLIKSLDLIRRPRSDSVKIADPKSRVNEEGLVTGYGYNEVNTVVDNSTRKRKRFGGKTDFYLRSGRVKLVELSRCNELYPGIRNPAQLCGFMEPNESGEFTGICECDGGSPLIIDESLVGLASRKNYACDDTTYGSVYTNVSHFKPFIDAVVAGQTYPDMKLHINYGQDIPSTSMNEYSNSDLNVTLLIKTG